MKASFVPGADSSAALGPILVAGCLLALPAMQAAGPVPTGRPGGFWQPSGLRGPDIVATIWAVDTPVFAAVAGLRSVAPLVNAGAPH